MLPKIVTLAVALALPVAAQAQALAYIGGGTGTVVLLSTVKHCTGRGRDVVHIPHEGKRVSYGCWSINKDQQITLRLMGDEYVIGAHMFEQLAELKPTQEV